MPNYSFECPDCKHDFEEIVSVNNRNDPIECPKCGKNRCVRAVTVAALSYSGFKDPITRAGSGWNDVLGKVKKASGRKNTVRTR